MTPTHIIWRSDPDYEAARIDRVWNRRHTERYPIAIIKASEESHVIDAVKVAAEKQCRVAVRSGGHSWAVASLRDNSVLLDLGDLCEMSFDEATNIVTASPSTTGAEMTEFLMPFGRWFAGGHCPDVALGGFLLQGGVGWNARGWGWACEQVLAIDVVTASGDKVRADAGQNANLFFAARGVGPGFPGIITRFHLQTRSAPKAIHTSAYVYPLSAYEAAFSWILKLERQFDTDTEILFATTQPPDAQEPCLAVLLTTFKPSAASAHAALLPAEQAFPPNPLHHAFNTPTTLAAEYATQARLNPAAHRYYIDNAFLPTSTPDAELVEALRPALTRLPSRESYTFWYAMGAQPHPPGMAISGFKTAHYLALYTICKGEEEDAACEEYVKEVIGGLKGRMEGSYIGDIDLVERVGRFFGREQGERLERVRREWDPEGRICGYLVRGDGERGY